MKQLCTIPWNRCVRIYLSSNLWEISNMYHFINEQVYFTNKLLKVEMLIWMIYPVEGTITDRAKQAKIVYLFWPLKSDLGIQLKYQQWQQKTGSYSNGSIWFSVLSLSSYSHFGLFADVIKGYLLSTNADQNLENTERSHNSGLILKIYYLYIGILIVFHFCLLSSSRSFWPLMFKANLSLI